ncbi:MAG: hypothetical protein FWH53_09230 [Leptospirales bacterium]|nr:hypothetical protein [Leptospirales bacterium]
MNALFTEESYAEFLKKKKTINNSRIRGENETFWDAMLSKEADMTATPEGQELIRIIQNLED